MDFGITNNAKPALTLGGLGASAQPANTTPVADPYAQQSPPPVPQQSPPSLQQQSSYSQQTPNTAPRPAATGVSLKKGQKVSLSKMNSSLDNILVGLGWDTTQTPTGSPDLDVEVFMLNESDRIVGDDWFVFYNQLASPDGSVRHSGDNRTGQGTGDDEIIRVQLSRVAPQAKKLVFVVTISESKQRNHNFSHIQNAYIRVVDQSSNAELVRFNLTDYYSNVQSMLVGEIYKHNDEWKFNPVGEGLDNDLEGLCARFGVNVI